MKPQAPPSKIDSLSQEAELIIKEATLQAQKSLQQADEEIKMGLEAAYKQGQEQGHEQARHFQAKLSQLQTLMLEELKNQSLQITLDIAKNILNTLIQHEPEIIVKIVQTALSHVPDITPLWLRANPADAPTLKNNQSRLLPNLTQVASIQIKEDTHIERGGIVIHSESGVVDAQLMTQLEEIKRVLQTVAASS